MTTSNSKPSSKVSKSSPSPSKNPLNSSSTKSHSSSSSSALSSHLAMVELKSRVLGALSKLSNRDTHQIAVDDLEKIIRTLPADGVPVLLHALIHDPALPAPSPQDPPGSKHPSFLVACRESLRLLALLCTSHTDAASAHLPRIIAHVVRRLKDPASDSSVRDACRDAMGALATLYLRPSVEAAAAQDHGAGGGGGGGGGLSPVVALFVKPLFEAMGEQNKVVQGGASLCLAKVVECGGGGGSVGERIEGKVVTGGAVFQRLCPRICKLLGGQSFLAKGPLLSVVSSLAQVGAINLQSMQQVLQTIRECLENSDWATRKAAADSLCVLASHPSRLPVDGAESTITALEACRFDKVKPVRDSIMEALQLWKKVKGEYETSTQTKDSKNSNLTDKEENINHKGFNPSKKDSSAASSSSENDSVSRGNGTTILEKAALILKKKAPAFTDKELNPEFFQKLEERSLDDLTVEVMLPRRSLLSSHSQSEEGQEASYIDSMRTLSLDETKFQELNGTHELKEGKRQGAHSKMQDLDGLTRNKWSEQREIRTKESKLKPFDVDDRVEVCHKDSSSGHPNVSRSDVHTEGPFMSNKANWPVIQRQLAQLERQQASLMNMLQDFMGGSHNSIVTLENRVRGLEQVVEEMVHDLSISSGRRGGNMMLRFDNSSSRSSSKYSGPHNYSSKFGRIGEVRHPFSERFLSSDTAVSSARARDSPWRSESEVWDSYGYSASRNGVMNLKRGFVTAPLDGRASRTENNTDQVGGRRAWNKGSGPFRLGEGPSARSVWQASKDEATLEAIRVAGEDNGTSKNVAGVTVPELDAEAITDDNPGPDKGPLWASWTRAMDSLHADDVDSAYAEILSTDDDLLLVKLMDKSGPAFDQLSGEIASEVLHAIGQFILEQSLFDIALSWLQQLSELLVENGADFLRVSLERKRKILLNLHEASALEPPEDWEGPSPEQLMMHLASAWGINLQQLIK